MTRRQTALALRKRQPSGFADEAFWLIEVSDEIYAEATRFFSPQAVTDLLYAVGTYMLLARVARTGRVPLDATPAAASSLK